MLLDVRRSWGMVRARGVSRGLRRFPVFAVAAGGVLVGHWLTYALLLAEPARREAVLSSTGHGYLRVASVTVLVLILLALGSAVMCALDARSVPAGASRAARIRRLFPRLWLLQGATFAGMEVAERLVAGASLGDVLLGRVLLVGLLVQALAAVVGAVLLHVLRRAAAGLARLVDSLGTASAPRILPSLAPCLNRLRAPLLAGAAGLRGPPLA
jgi:hypothetical protein